MTQSFINIGEGYSDFFELQEIIHYNQSRISSIVLLHSALEKEPRTSVLIIMKPSRQGNFQAIYSIIDGMQYPYPSSNKRVDFIRAWAQEANIPVKELDVKASHHFHERALYEQYLIGVLRLQRLLPPLT